MITLVHLVRVHKGAPLRPVGVWSVDQDDWLSFYPTEHQVYEARGMKALFHHPSSTLEMWADYKAGTSPNWRRRGATTLFSQSLTEPELEAVYDEVVAESEAKAESISGSRGRAHFESEPSGFGWHASRIVIAQSWWIASELVRRHPELMVYEMHPGGGSYDVLCVATPDQIRPEASERIPLAMINRVGSIQAHAGDDQVLVASWEQVLASADPHWEVRELEAAVGWEQTSKPVTTRRALAYRFFATALNMLSNSSATWDVRREFVDSSGFHGTHGGYVAEFPAAIEAMRTTRALGIWGEPESHFWALLRGGKPVAVVSDEGVLYPSSGPPKNLVSAYEACGRRIIPMTASLLGTWL